MKFRTIVRHIREGVRNVVRNGWMSFASASSIFISLFILGVFLLLSLNVNHFAQQIESQVQIRVFLQLNADQTTIDKLNNEIGNMVDVKSVEYVSKDAGLDLLRKSLGEDADYLLEGFDETNNPLPDSFTVEVFEPKTIADVANRIKAINNSDATKPIMNVKYGQGTVEKLFKATDAVRNVGLVIVIGLAVTAMFLISNTIKVTILNRRREIGIMKLVGATNAFIRWPFFIEGALIGFSASLLTAIVLLYGYVKLIAMTKFDLGLAMITLVEYHDVAFLLTVTLVGIGTLIGVWGSTISVRKYLKV
ncbi:cell division transport system permease protein [Paenibacillus cellulosilyticus]|uniref:Cell division protein FtsX n=1 Tax=Paenibacillus cellulosilyticus TaxID=375489 RepID=A0A2V2YZ84_9BACL|nr:permease-like cell division protein FtsX [Paenibacillus cellulosilyticus]PWW08303.1 cell division transport system permease protein [Paenibacillus cellulosilyticus]QKS47903.1 ABC transporter permease [Paenibacillus cellulosilyticus]